MSERLALDRTLQLIQLDLFPDAAESAILTALTANRVRLRATARNLMSNAGQTALVTTLLLLTELGTTVSLDIPDAVPVARQPPLEGVGLKSSIESISSSLLMPLGANQPADVEVVFGDTDPSGDCWFLRIEADDWHCQISRQATTRATPVIGAQPFGAGLAAVAATAEIFRRTMRMFGEKSRVEPLREHNLGETRNVTIELPRLGLADAQLGSVDMISAGALTTAALYMLLRVPNLTAAFRVIDDDTATVENLNRYLLLTRDWIGRRKVDVLASHQREGIAVSPVAARMTEASVQGLLPLAERVLVGVDDIPSRWVAQRYSPGWVGVAATSHFETLISEHTPDSACSGCLHPYTDEGPDVPIPTISFVSAFAGFLLAYRLVRAVTGGSQADVTIAYPFNLGAERGIQTLPCAAHPRCPVRCHASRKISAAR